MGEGEDAYPEEYITPDEFADRLQTLLERGHRSHIVFDRAWTFRHQDADCPDWMVEITELGNREK